MGASLFLNIVTIGAAILMLCVACTIFYNKYHDIMDEFREMARRRRGEESQQQVPVEQDVEAAVTPPSATQVKSSPAPTKHKKQISEIRTIETSSEDDETGVPDDEAADWRQAALRAAAKRQEQNDISRLYRNQKSYEFNLNRAGSGREISVHSHDADSCSCYLETSCAEQSAVLPPPPKNTTTFSPLARSNITFTTTTQPDEIIDHHGDDISCMDYSVDSSMPDHKDSFSSFAKPNLGMMMDTTVDHEEPSSRLSYSHYIAGSSLGITGSHFDDIESVETSVIPPSEATSNEESDQYSIVRPSVLTFPRRNTLEATSTFSNKIVQVTNTEAVSPLRTKTKVSSLMGKSDLGMNDDGTPSDDSENGDDDLYHLKKKVTRTPHTVSTAGLWSPSSGDVESQLEQNNDVSSNNSPNDSFTSDKSSSDGGHMDTMEAIQREAKNECFAPFYASHSVHVCKSAACTSCRDPKKNEPIFLNATRTSDGQQYSLPRGLPKGWWQTNQLDQVGKLKRYVSFVLLTRQQEARHSIDESVEDHPFDEA